MGTKTLVNAPGLAERAYRIRRNALRMGEVQGQGYIAQALTHRFWIEIYFRSGATTGPIACCAAGART
jgi:transketolase N-terminal domain/subunit